MRSRLVAQFVISIVLATAATAATPPRAVRLATPWHPRAWSPVGSSLAMGLRVAIDPATGELVMPTAGPGDIVRVDRTSLVEHARADGSRYVVLDGLIRAYMTARVGPDGRLVLDCDHSASEHPAPAPSQPAEDR